MAASESIRVWNGDLDYTSVTVTDPGGGKNGICFSIGLVKKLSMSISHTFQTFSDFICLKLDRSMHACIHVIERKHTLQQCTAVAFQLLCGRYMEELNGWNVSGDANKTQVEKIRQGIGFSISVQISISQVFQSITDKVKIVPVYIVFTNIISRFDN